MVNYYDRKRFISKSTLARLADVSPRTFSRYLATRREILKIFGVTPKAQKLPPYAVRYICEDYCIDLPPELQDQQALNASPIRDIILKSWEEEQNFKNNPPVGQSRTTPCPDVVPLQCQKESKAVSLIATH